MTHRHEDAVAMVRAVATVVRERMAEALSDVAGRIKALEDLPGPRDGQDGKPGADGLNGKDGSQGLQGTTGPKGPEGAPGPPGERGLDGPEGRVPDGWADRIAAAERQLAAHLTPESLSVEDVSDSFTVLLRKELTIERRPMLQKRVVRDEQGRLARVVEELAE